MYVPLVKIYHAIYQPINEQHAGGMAECAIKAIRLSTDECFYFDDAWLRVHILVCSATGLYSPWLKKNTGISEQ
jgi:hypothetical protein